MRTGSLELVIFDCDGVLIDSERLGIKVDVQLLHEVGWPLSEAEMIERFVGRSNSEIQLAIESHLGHELPATWESQVEPRYREVFDAELAPVPGVVDALDRIRLETCVASSGTHEHLRYTLGVTGLYGRFEGRIFSAEDVTNGKPAPDLFLYAAREMGIDPGRCVVVEDSRSGVQAARAAGMRVLAYAGGPTPAELLDGPDTIVFDGMHELPELIGRGGAG